MNENLDLVEKLKDAQKGTKLWSPLCGECIFMGIIRGAFSPIYCLTKHKGGGLYGISFTANGECDGDFDNPECVLFPSKENRDWSTFKVPKKHKHFEPFQRVLCIINDNDCKIWAADFYSHYDEDKKQHYLISGVVVKDDDDNEIVPYGGNEGKLGKQVE